ncbi:MAG: O-antigen ligase family protein [Bryobacteraceae bacterium]
MKTDSLISARWPAVGLGFILAWLVASVWSSDQWPWNLAQAAIFLLVTAISVLVLAGKLNATFRWILVPFLAAASWGPVQIWLGVSIYKYATRTATLAWASYAGALWIALHVFVNADIARKFRAAAVGFAVAVAVEATLQKFASNGKVLWLISARRPEAVMGPFLNYDHYAAFVELLLPLALWSAWKDRQRAVVWLGAAAVLYGSVIASTSRAGSALATLEVLVLLWIILRYKTTNARSRVTFAIIAAGLLVIATLVVGSSILLNRFAENDPLAFRRRTLFVAVRIIQAHPWTGFGLGTWPTIYPAYSEYDELAFVNHAHNDWAEWAGDGGIPFAALMGLVALRALWLCRRAPWGIGIVSVLVHSLVDFPLQRPTVMLWLLTILGCLESTRAEGTSRSDSYTKHKTVAGESAVVLAGKPGVR